MNIQIHAVGILSTPAIEAYSNKRVLHIKKILGNNSNNAQVRIELGRQVNSHKQGDVFGVEINVDALGTVFRTESKGDQLYTAIDDAVSEMVRVIEKAKGKKETLFRRGAIKVKKLMKGLLGRED